MSDDGQSAFLQAAEALDAPLLGPDGQPIRKEMDVQVAPLKMNRRDRRNMRNNLRAFKRQAARDRDRLAKAAGTGTPAGRIEDHIREKGLRP